MSPNHPTRHRDLGGEMTEHIRMKITESTSTHRGPCSDAIDAAKHGDQVRVTIDHHLIAGTSEGVVVEISEGQRLVAFREPVPARPAPGVSIKGGLQKLYLDDDDMAHRYVTEWALLTGGES